MSSKPAAIPLFADAYLADTMHLSTEEHGAYLLLLMAAWRSDDCSLPNDPRKLARIAGLSPRRWGQISATILDFWGIENGRIFNQRLRKERGYVIRKSESNRENARKRWEAQGVENKATGECERTSDGNAPPPPPVDTNVSTESPHNPPAGKKPKAGAKFAMPADWQPTLPLPSDVAELVAQWPPGRLEREIADCRAYWIENGTKRPGWDRTLHSRIRTIHDRVMRDYHHGSGHRNADPDEPRNPYVRAVLKREADRAGHG